MVYHSMMLLTTEPMMALRRAIMGSVVSNIMEWYTIGVCPSTPISPS